MGPRKRVRNDDDDEVVAVESASSNLRLSAQHKKARLSATQNSKSRNARERSASTSSSDDDEQPQAEPDVSSGPPATQYDLMRDNGFKHLQNPDEDDALAHRAFNNRRRGQIGDNVAADNAIIEEVTCINFMCHTKLHVQLSPLINFVVGMNGSGKSAVLTAITLCLGGKASATNRGASLKSLIRGDEDQAILTVRLKNEGSDAYQPDLYGDSIIVERQFSKSGSSGYKLKNAMGRTLSTKKGDVDDIIEYFNLQVDNPMNVLTQDAAKSFIQNSTPTTKYKFFVEGVQLQQLDNDYRLVSDTCDMIEAKLEESKADIKILERNALAAQEKKDLIAQHQGTKEAAAKLRDQLVWVQIEEQEARLARRESNIAAARDIIAQAEREAEEKERALEQVQKQMEHAEEAVRHLEEELVPLTDEGSVAKEAHEDAMKQIQNVRTQQRDIKSSITAAKKKATGYETAISKEKRRIEDANGGAHARKLAEIEDARHAATAAKEALDNSEQETPRLAEKLRSAQDESRRADALLDPKKAEIEECRKRLHDLTNKQGNIMDGFDPNMPRLLQAIRNDRGFREQPVGPVGLHIKLLKPMWSNTIEAFIGRNLSAFIVTSKVDQMRLHSMMRQCRVDNSPILIGNHHPIDTTGHEPDPQYETVLRVLEFNNDLVRSQLIIHHSIEQCLLIPKRTDAWNVMYSGAKPRNTKGAFSFHDSRRDCGHSFKYTGSANNDMDLGPVRYLGIKQKPRMKTDVQSQISLQNETLQHLLSEKNELESRSVQLRWAMNKCSTAVNTQKRNHDLLKVTLQRAEDRVEKLESDLDRDNVEDGLIDALKESLAEAEREVVMYQETYMAAVTEMDKLNAVSKEKKEKLEKVKELGRDQEAKLNKAKLKVRNTGQARSMVLREKNIAFERIDTIKGEMAGLEQQRDEQAVVVDDHVKQASEICDRVQVPQGETRASLESKFGRLNQKIKAYRNKLGGTEQEIEEALEKALGLYQQASNYQTDMEDLLKILKNSFAKRMKAFWRFQRYISAASRIAFSYLLAHRGFRGKLLIDHKAKKLDVHVEPDETTKSSKGRQTKTLSGGEKSFSSICLLLALWEAMGSPLRCLDEYDVFMDDVNRDVSTKMIISAARYSVGRQYIMITPKALGSGAADAPDVKIHKLDDPRNKQKRIDEMLQAE